MAGTRPEVISKQKNWQALGDWVAPLLAFLTVVGIMLALVSALLESAR